MGSTEEAGFASANLPYLECYRVSTVHGVACIEVLPWLVPIGIGRAEGRETNNKWCHGQWQVEPTNSGLVPIHLPADFYKATLMQHSHYTFKVLG